MLICFRKQDVKYQSWASCYFTLLPLETNPFTLSFFSTNTCQYLIWAIEFRGRETLIFKFSLFHKIYKAWLKTRTTCQSGLQKRTQSIKHSSSNLSTSEDNRLKHIQTWVNFLNIWVGLSKQLSCHRAQKKYSEGTCLISSGREFHSFCAATLEVMHIWVRRSCR